MRRCRRWSNTNVGSILRGSVERPQGLFCMSVISILNLSLESKNIHPIQGAPQVVQPESLAKVIIVASPAASRHDVSSQFSNRFINLFKLLLTNSPPHLAFASIFCSHDFPHGGVTHHHQVHIPSRRLLILPETKQNYTILSEETPLSTTTTPPARSSSQMQSSPQSTSCIPVRRSPAQRKRKRSEQTYASAVPKLLRKSLNCHDDS